MSQFYYQPGQASMASRSSLNPAAHHHNNNNNNNNHRSRRSTRYSTAHTGHKQYKDTSRSQAQKVSVEAAVAAALRKEFEAARSFDLEDDEIFCPYHLLTQDDLQSIHSASSDRASTSGSESPDHSPLQQQLQPTAAFALPPTSHHVMASAFQPAHQAKIHAPQAQRTRNAIPIVDPNSRHTSPPNSISPNHQAAQKYFYNSRR